ncbi:uncharacterized protein TRUGW13939_00081 [Talaromyces rugulosus]|uniref:F-box domain-containing protein n=1 Tax=Talaromyces rugulosus TaxID=121627 RepID=A0A7H8QGC6_TALRU|nr:uncharacterized protein TRUGW13939_00081 [Talaromyces rugulosus]QKX53010.1 hypothetical protein TRUGW13939_00081 [Talaromyces rugulosus]
MSNTTSKFLPPFAPQQTVPTTTAKLSLEYFPPEVLALVLHQIPDFDSLKSLVFSSPKFYYVYCRVRQEVLSSLLKRQYGDLLDIADGITAVRSKGLWLNFHEEEAIALLDAWRRKEEIQDYAKNAPRPRWIQLEPTQWHQKILPLDLSDTEKPRFMRGLCRLQIFFNIFGIREQCWFDKSPALEEENDWHLHTDYENHTLFWDIMFPWECEELGCVWSYLTDKYKPISKEIATDLRNLVPNIECHLHWQSMSEEERPKRNTFVDVECYEAEYDGYFEILMSVGLGFLYRVLNADRLLRRNLVIANSAFYSEDIAIPQWCSCWVNKRPRIPLNQHDILEFEQLWSTLPSHEQPNIGWKVSWLVSHTPRRRLYWSFKENRERCKDWDWGYALWDEERLEGWGEDWKATLFEPSAE